jgi:hypothetical protein
MYAVRVDTVNFESLNIFLDAVYLAIVLELPVVHITAGGTVVKIVHSFDELVIHCFCHGGYLISFSGDFTRSGRV